MARYVIVISALAMSLLFSAQAHAQAQDSPSLGDVARQAKKEKADKPVAKVFTNDDMSTGTYAAPSAASPGASSGKTQSASRESAGAAVSPTEAVERLQSALDHLASLDRRSLALEVLDGNGNNFAGRAAWEEKLFAAKQDFVAQTTYALQKAKEIAVSGQALKDAQDANDPRVKALAAKLGQLVQETQKNAAAFHAVATEGRELAGLPSPE